jgi:hypothetical protein
MDNEHNTDMNKDTNREKDTTGMQTDRDRDTKGRGHKWTGMQVDRDASGQGQVDRDTSGQRKTDRDWDTDVQRQGNRRTGRGAGKQINLLVLQEAVYVCVAMCIRVIC